MSWSKLMRHLAGAGLVLLWVLPATGQEIVPGTTTYVQYRSYEPFSPKHNQYVAWASYQHADGSPISQDELAGVPVITDPSLEPVEADPSNPSPITFWETFYGVGSWNPASSSLTILGAFDNSGYQIELGNPPEPLGPGTYTFSVLPAGSGAAIVSTTEFPPFNPAFDALIPVQSALMQNEWVEVDGQLYLQLSWPPVPDFIDRYQVLFLHPATGKDIFYGLVPPNSGDFPAGAGSVPPGWPWLRIGEDLLAQLVAVMGPLDGVNWVVQTRRYFNSQNYVRSYSEPVWVSFETPGPPANDLFVNATVVEPVPFSDFLDTRYATTDSDDVPHCNDPYGSSLQGTVWYAYTATADLLVNANTYGSSYPALLNVLQGTPGDFTLVACGWSEVNFMASPGETYYFLIGADGWWGEPGGDLSFYLNATEPLAIGLSVDPKGTFDRVSGAALISGTVICNRPVDIFLNGTVRQTVGRFNVIEASFYQTVPCDSVTTWQASAMSPAGRFGGGSAYVHLNASAFEPSTGQSDFAELTDVVSLRGGGGPKRARR